MGRSIFGQNRLTKKEAPTYWSLSFPHDLFGPPFFHCGPLKLRVWSRFERLVAGNRVLAAGFGAGIALVRPLLLIFSICDSHFPIRWRLQRVQIHVPTIA